MVKTTVGAIITREGNGQTWSIYSIVEIIFRALFPNKAANTDDAMFNELVTPALTSCYAGSSRGFSFT
jgi:hypothetical protein